MQWIHDAASSLASAFGYENDNQNDKKDDNRSGLQAVTTSAHLQHSTMLSKVQAYEPWCPSACQDMNPAPITCSSPTCRQQKAASDQHLHACTGYLYVKSEQPLRSWMLSGACSHCVISPLLQTLQVQLQRFFDACSIQLDTPGAAHH